MMRIFLIFYLTMSLYSCKKEYQEPIPIREKPNALLKKVILYVNYFNFPQRKQNIVTVKFNYYPDGKVKSARKEISWDDITDTIIDISNFYSDNYLKSQITSITSPAGTVAISEEYSYQNGRIHSYYNGKEDLNILFTITIKGIQTIY